MNKIKITDIEPLFPTKKEIQKEANSYDNAMTSMAEGMWMPEGFKEGAKWVIEEMKKKLEK